MDNGSDRRSVCRIPPGPGPARSRRDPRRASSGYLFFFGCVEQVLRPGRCDLSTVVATDGTLADAAATYACNLVETASDIGRALELKARIPGNLGAPCGSLGESWSGGNLLELIRNDDRRIVRKIICVLLS